MSDPLLQVQAVDFTYPGGTAPVLRGVDLELARGSTVALLGASGSGKSTLLYLCGLLARPGAGRILLDGVESQSLGEAARESLRNQRLGFVFQHHFLLGDFTAEENAAMPLWIRAGRRTREGLEKARSVLEFVGLGDKLGRHPAQLSGGERQRVSIARAVVHGPDLVLADEPTGSLDSESGNRVFQLLLDLQAARDCGILLVTHNPVLAARCHRTVTMVDGQIRESPSRSESAG